MILTNCHFLLFLKCRGLTWHLLSCSSRHWEYPTYSASTFYRYDNKMSRYNHYFPKFACCHCSITLQVYLFKQPMIIYSIYIFFKIPLSAYLVFLVVLMLSNLTSILYQYFCVYTKVFRDQLQFIVLGTLRQLETY